MYVLKSAEHAASPRVCAGSCKPSTSPQTDTLLQRACPGGGTAPLHGQSALPEAKHFISQTRHFHRARLTGISQRLTADVFQEAPPAPQGHWGAGSGEPSHSQLAFPVFCPVHSVLAPNTSGVAGGDSTLETLLWAISGLGIYLQVSPLKPLGVAMDMKIATGESMARWLELCTKLHTRCAQSPSPLTEKVPVLLGPTVCTGHSGELTVALQSVWS